MIITMVFIAIAVPLSGCTNQAGNATATPVPTTAPVQTLKLATTTSVNDSGLLNYILPDFEKENNVNVQVLSAGSGQAIAYGASGDVDVLIVHSPAAETTFMNQGHGWNRTQFAHNFFVIVGPTSDPAGIKGLNATQAYDKIAQAKSTFVARVDASGTDTKNRDIWNKTSLKAVPSNVTNTWYKATGSGMGDTLRMADQLQAYTLSDIATYESLSKSLNLTILVENDPVTLINKYDVIAVNQTEYPSVNYPMAKKLIDYLASQPTQQKIAEYGQAQYGRPLFYADLLNNSTSSK
ncbi:MAG TPA: substrate-binding domain-containing protein [Methanocella sp.]|uniref:substrate-binding domain-containing protein n=1 Tax=Methanocella sp. TaxID=2052833 RepID=UPI002BE1FEC1|nr:substrate-binding domain-containing protein [Methanocella sp.]HTY90169.1 substrate-binding domain-containing protein [Methanocella sp.]